MNFQIARGEENDNENENPRKRRKLTKINEN